MQADFRALVLVAGKGMRLRPLTDSVPKALLPILGTPLVAVTLSRLASAGCDAAALNLHHLGESIRDCFGEAHGSLPLTYSPEPDLLGTSGALVPLHEFLQPAELVLVVNGDSLCNWPVEKLIRRHLKTGAAATLLVSKTADPGSYGGGVGIDESGGVVSFRSPAGTDGGEKRRVFMGAHVFSPGLVGDLEPGPSDFVSDVYEPALRKGARIEAVETRRKWHDLGTPSRYLGGVLDWNRSWIPGRRAWVHSAAEVHRDARLRNCVVESGAMVESGVSLEDCLVLPGARVAAGSLIRNSIVGHGVRLEEGTGVEGRMITSIAAGARPREVDSVVGDHVFTPL